MLSLESKPSLKMHQTMLNPYCCLCLELPLQVDGFQVNAGIPSSRGNLIFVAKKPIRTASRSNPKILGWILNYCCQVVFIAPRWLCGVEVW